MIYTGCTTEPVETDLLLPVDFSNIPDNMVLTDFHTDKIEIRVKGKPELIEKINTEAIRYPVDLYTDLEFDPAGDSDSIEPGIHLIPLEDKRIPIDPNIDVLSVTPPYLSVMLEKKLKKSFKITVPYSGEAAKGFIALDAATEPASVEISGPAPIVNAIPELRTKPIDLSGAKEDFKKEIPLDLDSTSFLTASTPIVVVSVPVQEQLVSKSISEIPVQIRHSDLAVHIEPPEISIEVKGPFEALKNKKLLDDIYAFIDLKDLSPGVYARHAIINIPVELIMTDASPRVFTIKIE